MQLNVCKYIRIYFNSLQEEKLGLPHGPVARTPCFNAGGPGLVPSEETISHMPPTKSLARHIKEDANEDQKS